MRTPLLVAVGAAALLAGCDTMRSWMRGGGPKPTAKLEPTKDKKQVVLVLKGKAAGETYCRAGTSLGPTVLVHITVVEPPL